MGYWLGFGIWYCGGIAGGCFAKGLVDCRFMANVEGDCSWEVDKLSAVGSIDCRKGLLARGVAPAVMGRWKGAAPFCGIAESGLGLWKGCGV